MARSDYAHWNEDQDLVWWQEEGRFGGTEHEVEFCDICMSYHSGPCPEEYPDPEDDYEEEDEDNGEDI